MLYFDNILYGRHSQTQCLMYCDMALKRHFVELGGHLHLHKHTAFQRVQDFIPCLYTGPVFFSGFEEVQTMFAGTVQTGILNAAELRYKELLTGCPMVQVTKANVTKWPVDSKIGTRDMAEKLGGRISSSIGEFIPCSYPWQGD